MRSLALGIPVSLFIVILCSIELRSRPDGQSSRSQERGPTSSPSVVDVASDNLALMESEWLKRCNQEDSLIDKTRKITIESLHFDQLVRIVTERVPNEQDHSFLSHLVNEVDGKTVPTSFVDTTTQAFVVVLSRRRDRQTLVELLSRCCPSKIVNEPIEFCLAAAGDPSLPRPPWDDGLPDGILILCDAFEQAKSQTVRATIAQAMTRAFGSQIRTGPNNSEIVSESRGWYLKNRSRVEINVAYHSDDCVCNALAEAYRQRRRPVNEPLFVPLHTVPVNGDPKSLAAR